MKVRFGVSLGANAGPAEFAGIVNGLESAGVDSLWLPESVCSDSVESFVGMAYARSRTTRRKVGTSVAILVFGQRRGQRPAARSTSGSAVS